MLNTVDTILNNINSKNREYYIQPYYVQKMLKDIIKEGSKLKKELSKFANIDFTNNKEVIGFINQTLLGREFIKGKTVSNTILEELHIEFKYPFFKTLILYRKSRDRFTKLCSFIKNAIDPDFNKNNKERVKGFCRMEFTNTIPFRPQAKVNESGGVTLSNPALQFSVEDIRQILGWNVAISFKEMEELLSFLEIYSDLIIHASNEYNYLVIGTTIYADMITDEIDAFPFEPVEYYELIREFQREYMG